MMDARRELYDEGLPDCAIARAVGAKQNTITVWRRKAGLPVNARLTPEEHARRLLLHSLGWGDYSIARELGVPRESVTSWRARKMGLKANFRPGRAETAKGARPPSMEDVLRRVRRAIGRALPKDIADDAASDLFMALLDGTITIKEIEGVARKYGNRVLDKFASRFGPKSLDEALPGMEDVRGVDLLVDERSSSWLEEMGATVW